MEFKEKSDIILKVLHDYESGRFKIEDLYDKYSNLTKCQIKTIINEIGGYSHTKRDLQKVYINQKDVEKVFGE